MFPGNPLGTGFCTTHTPRQSSSVTPEFAQVPLSSLSIGAVLHEPIFEEGTPRKKLLGSEIEISESILQQLSSRGIGHVSVSKA